MDGSIPNPGICVYSFVLISNARLLKDFLTCREKIPCLPITKHLFSFYPVAMRCMDGGLHHP